MEKYLRVRRLNIVKTATLPKVIHSHLVPSKFQLSSFRHGQDGAKIHMEVQGAQRSQNNLEEEQS